MSTCLNCYGKISKCICGREMGHYRKCQRGHNETYCATIYQAEILQKMMTKICKKIDNLSENMEALIYAPDGPVYQHAKDNFEELVGKEDDDKKTE